MKSWKLEPLSDRRQPEEEDTFLGGKPKLPPDVSLPSCRLCGKELAFFFQVAFPQGHKWEGKSMAVFYCVEEWHDRYCIPELPDGPVDETGLLDHKGVQLGHRHPPPGGKVDAAIPPDPEVQVFHRLALQLVGDGAVGGDDGAGGDGFLWHRKHLRVQRMAPLRQAARGALGWDRTMLADWEGERKRGIF